MIEHGAGPAQASRFLGCRLAKLADQFLERGVLTNRREVGVGFEGHHVGPAAILALPEAVDRRVGVATSQVGLAGGRAGGEGVAAGRLEVDLFVEWITGDEGFGDFRGLSVFAAPRRASITSTCGILALGMVTSAFRISRQRR